MTIKEYYSKGMYTKAEAQVIGKELEKLANRKKSTADDIVKAAKSASSPLHPFFEWDDAKAAHEHRKEQARSMSRHILVHITNPDTGEQREQRAFYAINTGPPKARPFDAGEKRYLTIDQVNADDDYRNQVIQQALSQLQSWRQRYAEYEEIFGQVFAAVDELEHVEELELAGVT